MANQNEELQRKHLEIGVRNGVFGFTDTFFVYTSGLVAPTYAQSANVTKNGRDYQEVIQDLCSLLYDGADSVISGGETRDWIFSFPVAAKLAKPHVMLYKDGRSLGADLDGRKVMHVADLNSQGSSPRDYWVPAIRGAGGEISQIFFYIDRMEGGHLVMPELGLTSKSLVRLDNSAWDILRERGLVDDTVYTDLYRWKEDPIGWGEEKLQSPEGVSKLLGMLQGTNREKVRAENVLNVGYPEIREEMLARLREIGFEGVFPVSWE